MHAWMPQTCPPLSSMRDGWWLPNNKHGDARAISLSCLTNNQPVVGVRRPQDGVYVRARAASFACALALWMLCAKGADPVPCAAARHSLKRMMLPPWLPYHVSTLFCHVVVVVVST